MMDKEYQTTLSEAIALKREHIEKSILSTLKEDLRAFYTAYQALYGMLLTKGMVKEDPYRQDVQIAEIQIPETGAIPENEKNKQLTIRLASYDAQLDVLVNFYQFNTTYFTLDRIKRVLGLIKYIDWINLTPDSSSPITQAVAEITNQLRQGADALGLGGIVGLIQRLSRLSRSILASLKVLFDFNREVYKLDVRTAVSGKIHEGKKLSLGELKKLMAANMPGKPVYSELLEEVIKEDYSASGTELRERVLKSLKVEEKKQKAAPQEVPYKQYLVEGVQIISSLAPTLAEIEAKLQVNEGVLANRKLSFWAKVKRFLVRMSGREPDPVMYELVYEHSGASPVRETINLNELRNKITKKAKQFASAQAMTPARVNSLKEEQLTSFLEHGIKDVQSLYKILNALDAYFKQKVDTEDRSQIKGIKPELSTLKNTYLKANQRRSDYTLFKEEAEQLKKLNLDPQA
ncbi:MAG: hypothetical protein LBD74_05990 [Spirochaetaceae bacterium]|jgi:hypothetical protein|nr:hypothetical protein [Spirochaetaceae bacterium]